MSSRLICVVAVLSFCLFTNVPLYADTTGDEIASLKATVKELLKRIEKLEQGQVQVKEEAVKAAKEEAREVSGLPEWAEKMTWKGDVRVRNEQIWNEPGTNRSRQRIRLRFGFETEINEKVRAGARLVSGGQSVTSTNQTLDNVFEHPDIAFDLGYITYKPKSWLTLNGGIFKNPYYKNDDLIWDGDLTFQGLAGGIKADMEKDLGIEGFVPTTLFATFGGYPLDELSGTSHDPWLMAGQAGFKSEIMKNVSLGAGAAYYDFAQVQGAVLPHRENDNTNIGGNNTAFANDYNVLGINGALEIKNVFNLGRCDGPIVIDCNNIPIAFIGDYVDNEAVSDKNTGWLAGIRIGPKKLKKQGKWKLYYNYRVLEADAFLDVFPDGDPQSGGTNLRSHEIIFDYAIAKNIFFGLDYYNTKEDSGTSQDQDILETDIVVKF